MVSNLQEIFPWPGVDHAVLTLDEVKQGWAIGPLEFLKLPKEAVASKRFGV